METEIIYFIKTPETAGDAGKEPVKDEAKKEEKTESTAEDKKVKWLLQWDHETVEGTKGGDIMRRWREKGVGDGASACMWKKLWES